MEKDSSTEEKIKEAARKLFQKKGYEGTKSREIAEEAGINLALLNYYYRSKEKLFDIIMAESVNEMFAFMMEIADDLNTSIEEKIYLITNNYVDLIKGNPHLPLFVLREIQSNPDKFIEKSNINRNFIRNSTLYKQLDERSKIKNPDPYFPLQVFINIISMAVFPVIAKPLLTKINEMTEDDYQTFLEKRRTLIPQWIEMMLDLKDE
ncbi:TetR/AcrR family transcriptional regulator [Dysgonomonas sp. 520]|uniref:TetR/AcrR family transcriptional regulator n=1 Tax=Dysgonomonas sp. 520 TaxID=2302931 RepID=UPI0013D74C07|nr:TetR/AcrR family transcriptional regulator [Dysgonomonas sp. 520]NDW09668.1 TetR/AcrR family transcriptional regulator [Dysgonomonas sp. 520]